MVQSVLLQIYDNHRYENLGHCHFYDENRREILKEIKAQNIVLLFMIFIDIRK